MNWLAKINLPIVVKRLGTFRSALLLFSTIALCLFVGYRIGNYFHGYQKQTIQQQKQRLDELYQIQEESLKRIHTLEVELEVEKLANQRASAEIKAMETEHFEVRKELGFYQKIMAPEKQADGLIVDEVQLYKTESPNHYRFAVVLVQQTLRKRFAKGNIDLTLSGSQNNKPTKLKLKDISKVTKEQLSFSLRYFQRIEGEFTLPEGFVPEGVKVLTTLPKGKWQKFNQLSQDYVWNDIIVQS